MPTETELSNLQSCRDWARHWNEDADRMTNQCYAPACVVRNMLTSDILHGRAALTKAEHAMRAARGARRIEITRMAACGDKVAVQMEVFWRDRRFKTCAFMTFDHDGLIILESWYGEGDAGRLLLAA